jgi:hypothetical protein
MMRKNDRIRCVEPTLVAHVYPFLWEKIDARCASTINACFALLHDADRAYKTDPLATHRAISPELVQLFLGAYLTLDFFV